MNRACSEDIPILLERCWGSHNEDSEAPHLKETLVAVRQYVVGEELS